MIVWEFGLVDIYKSARSDKWLLSLYGVRIKTLCAEAKLAEVNESNMQLFSSFELKIFWWAMSCPSLCCFAWIGASFWHSERTARKFGRLKLLLEVSIFVSSWRDAIIRELSQWWVEVARTWDYWILCPAVASLTTRDKVTSASPSLAPCEIVSIFYPKDFRVFFHFLRVTSQVLRLGWFNSWSPRLFSPWLALSYQRLHNQSGVWCKSGYCENE